MSDKVKKIIAGILVLAAGTILGTGITITIKPKQAEQGTTEVVVEVPVPVIELSEKQVPATIETADGDIEVVDIPTVEAVDSGNVSKLTECPEGEEECGLGKYIWAPTDTPQAFAEYTFGKCFDTDSAWNEQCWDYGDLFFQNYAGRRLSTCDTGAAKGTWEGDCKFVNAGDDFELIYNADELQTGDWVVFNNGIFGHIGFALGNPTSGYIALQGQNQGGPLCEGSTMGGRANIINISLKNFAGAFRPKAYIKPAPAPEPEELPDTSH